LRALCHGSEIESDVGGNEAFSASDEAEFKGIEHNSPGEILLCKHSHHTKGGGKTPVNFCWREVKRGIGSYGQNSGHRMAVYQEGKASVFSTLGCFNDFFGFPQVPAKNIGQWQKE
jgi:hypothetical protein